MVSYNADGLNSYFKAPQAIAVQQIQSFQLIVHVDMTLSDRFNLVRIQKHSAKAMIIKSCIGILLSFSYTCHYRCSPLSATWFHLHSCQVTELHKHKIEWYEKSTPLIEEP